MALYTNIDFDLLLDVDFDRCHFSYPCQHKITYMKNNEEYKKFYHAPAILDMIIKYRYPVKYTQLEHMMIHNYRIEIIDLFDKLKIRYNNGSSNALIYDML